MDEGQRYKAHVKRLEEIYPRAMRNVYCGISTPEGWYHIVEALLVNIKHHIDHKRKRRADALLMNRAIKRGRDAVMARVCNKDKEPSDWQIERVDQLMARGVEEAPAYVSHIEVHQIKEKFAGLRFYFQGGDDAVWGMVEMAEVWAAQSCEVCGERGIARHGGWSRTLCGTHEAERQERMSKYKSEDDDA